MCDTSYTIKNEIANYKPIIVAQNRTYGLVVCGERNTNCQMKLFDKNLWLLFGIKKIQFRKKVSERN